MWKKIHVKLKFLRLEFHHLLSQCLFFFSSSSSLLQPVLLLSLFFSPPARASSSFPVLLSSIPCFFFFFFPYSTSLDLRSPKRSSNLILLPSFLVLHLHRHLRCCSSMELESLRLQFHLTKTSPCQQSKLESLWLNFFAELKPQRLEMLFSSILSNSC